MGVEECGLRTEFLEYCREDTRVETGAPGSGPDTHAGGTEAAGQLRIFPGDNDLVDATPA
jgi:hypothetical protein